MTVVSAKVLGRFMEIFKCETPPAVSAKLAAVKVCAAPLIVVAGVVAKTALVVPEQTPVAAVQVPPMQEETVI